MKCHGLEQGKFWGTFGTVCSSRSFAKSCSTLCHPMDLRLPCPSPSPRACSNSRPSSRWCHPTISSSAVPFSSCLQSFQHQGPFQWVDLALSQHRCVYTRPGTHPPQNPLESVVFRAGCWGSGGPPPALLCGSTASFNPECLLNRVPQPGLQGTRWWHLLGPSARQYPWTLGP